MSELRKRLEGWLSAAFYTGHVGKGNVLEQACAVDGRRSRRDEGGGMKVKGFDCRDMDCPRRFCWSPGKYEHRGATGAGSRNTGSYSNECLGRAYRGCPHPIPDFEQTGDQYYAARRAEREGGTP